VIVWQLMRTAIMLEPWRQVLWGDVSTGAEEDESNTGHIWAAGFHHVTGHSHLVGVLELTVYFFNFSICLCGLQLTIDN
jgi:hypothetical protein